MQLQSLKEFLARQLNDHSESPSGVVQKTFFEWTENHIEQAIELSLCYLYSLLPQEFSSVEEHTVLKEDCVLSFCEECSKFLGLVSLQIEDKTCIDLEQGDSSNNSLTSLLDIGCIGDKDGSSDHYEWTYASGSQCVVLFDNPVPEGAVLRYLCATPPTLEDLKEGNICEYETFIAEHALFWLFRTDSDSRSNLERANLHFEALKFFVTTKLLLEFSLREDDYDLSRRKVDD